MTLKDYLRSLSVDEKRAFARAAGTSYEYVKQMAGGWRLPSARMAIALERASSGRIGRSELRPDYWEPPPQPHRKAS